jgi:hypothetical protein
MMLAPFSNILAARFSFRLRRISSVHWGHKIHVMPPWDLLFPRPAVLAGIESDAENGKQSAALRHVPLRLGAHVHSHDWAE